MVKRIEKNHQELLFSDKAYLSLKELILSLKISPGELLSELRLSSLLGMSRTPVREALKKLKAEGYLISQDKKGYFVNILTLKEFKDVYEVRTILEGGAAKLASKGIDLVKLESYERQFNEYKNSIKKDGDSFIELAKKDDFIKLSREFHFFIIDSTGNKKLRELIEKIYDQLTITRTFTYDKRRKEAVDEHLNIIKSLKERDGAKSLLYMEEHLRNAFDVLTRFL